MRLKARTRFVWSLNGIMKEYKSGQHMTVEEKEAWKMISAGLAEQLKENQNDNIEKEKELKPEKEDKMMRPTNKKTKSKKMRGENEQ